MVVFLFFGLLGASLASFGAFLGVVRSGMSSVLDYSVFWGERFFGFFQERQAADTNRSHSQLQGHQRCPEIEFWGSLRGLPPPCFSLFVRIRFGRFLYGWAK